MGSPGGAAKEWSEAAGNVRTSDSALARYYSEAMRHKVQQSGADPGKRSCRVSAFTTSVRCYPAGTSAGSA